MRRRVGSKDAMTGASSFGVEGGLQDRGVRRFGGGLSDKAAVDGSSSIQ